MEENIRLLYIDLFCGAGGTSTGVEKATNHGNKCAKVIAVEVGMARVLCEALCNRLDEIERRIAV